MTDKQSRMNLKGARKLTAEKLRELLSYDPETGEFTWLVDRTSGPGYSSTVIHAGDHTGSSTDAKGYLRVTIDRHAYFAHQLAFLYMTGRWPTDQIDHINQNKNDNRWVNLREATNGQNQANRFTEVRDLPRGVYRNRRKFSASCGKTYLGLFNTPEEANARREKAAKEMYGEYVSPRLRPKAQES